MNECSVIVRKSFNLLIFMSIFLCMVVPIEGSESLDEPIRKVVCPSSETYSRHSEGDIVVLEDSTLLLAWSRFHGASDHATAEIAAKRSEDMGRTWGDPYVLQENIGEQNVMSASFLRLRSSKILFFFLVKNGLDDLHVYMRSSQDEAQTWSEPKRVSTRSGYNIMNNARPVQLSSGRILAPIALSPHIGEKYNDQVSFCYISDDEGKSWKEGKGAVRLSKNEPAMEPGVVELKDGSVFMIIRTKLDRIYYAISHDQGETWSEAMPMELTAPAAPATITRIPATEELLIVWNHNLKGHKAGWQGRTPLTAAISQDEGKTWKFIKNIEEDPQSGYAYTSITWFKGNALLTYYHWKQGHANFEQTRLVFHAIPYTWFYP